MAWIPFQGGFDPHGSEQDTEANDAFFKFAEYWKPVHRIAGGDIWNFAQIRKGADAHERKDSMSKDYADGRQWIERFRPSVFLRGNHDERLWDLAEQGEGLIADHAKMLCGEIEKLMRDIGCQMIPYDVRGGVYRTGHLKWIHGYCHGINAARESARTYGNVVMGHGHAIQQQSIEGLEQRTGWMAGCLCRLDAKYARARHATLRWEHGWVYGLIDDETGDFWLQQARKVGGKWIVPTGVQELGAIAA